VVHALRQNTAFLQREVAQRLGLKFAPKLKFRKDESFAEADRIEALPAPRIAAMIGGRSKAFDLTEGRATELGRQIAGAVAAAGGSLLMTFSRRTPGPAQAALRAALAESP
jgi:mitochondrial fission protein ELM1